MSDMANSAKEAAAILWAHWQGGTCISALPENCRPADIEAGYLAQQAMIEISGQKPVGYKIAASSKAGQAHLKITHPVYGRLLESKVLISGEKATWLDHPMSVAELEFAFRFGSDLPARKMPYEMAEVMAFVDAMHIGIELPGSRFKDAAGAGIAQIIADNASANLYVLGPQAAGNWRGVDLAGHKVRMLVDGVEKTRGVGGDALDDPRLSLTWLVNQLGQKDVGIEKGQMVTTGVCGQPVAVFQGQNVVGDFGEFGEVSVQLV